FPLSVSSLDSSYTLSLHDALPISSPEGGAFGSGRRLGGDPAGPGQAEPVRRGVDDRPGAGPTAEDVGDARPVVHSSAHWFGLARDRKSTRLNSSHVKISYAVFCLE